MILKFKKDKIKYLLTKVVSHVLLLLAAAAALNTPWISP